MEKDDARDGRFLLLLQSLAAREEACDSPMWRFYNLFAARARRASKFRGPALYDRLQTVAPLRRHFAGTTGRVGQRRLGYVRNALTYPVQEKGGNGSKCLCCKQHHKLDNTCTESLLLCVESPPSMTQHAVENIDTTWTAGPIVERKIHEEWMPSLQLDFHQLSAFFSAVHFLIYAVQGKRGRCRVLED
jgi:hypothetical protein